MNSTSSNIKRILKRVIRPTERSKLKSNFFMTLLSKKNISTYKSKSMNDININLINKSNIISDYSNKNHLNSSKRTFGDHLVQKFLNQKISVNNNFRHKEFPFKKFQKIKHDLFSSNSEKDSLDTSFYDKFNNYKIFNQKDDSLIRPKREKYNFLSNTELPYVKNIYIGKALFRKKETDSSQNSIIINHDYEKNSIASIFKEDNSKCFLQRKLSKINNITSPEFCNNESNIDNNDNTNYLKDVISKNKHNQKFVGYNTFAKKNRDFLSILNKKFRLKQKSNKVTEEKKNISLIKLVTKNRNNTMKNINNKMNKIQGNIHNINEKLGRYLNKIRIDLDNEMKF